ncbi:glycosyltransferase [Chryseobacterium gotjawalense]|uniref:Glycosyltransferase n=1 Tax=Chryseobacterium gotjawalense TaxID=3042315 RepID=A0ABY8REG3_9FLAO|nr:glycosyltransferase [Chryseobacterium sp. wdc7]WHF51427.1 glycosyltransferase [Chryseobacterium sp. wdc7]
MIDCPKVSVCIITYNHEKFIEKALSSIVMQKTGFPFEIIISNDCSTDITGDIIRNFISSNPFKRITYYNHDKNIGANANFIFVQKKALGQYIAFCEGDDYWLDDRKLQKQFDLLDSNNDISLCYTSRIVVDQYGALLSGNHVPEKLWTSNEIALGTIPPLQSVFSKNFALEFEEFMKDHPYSYGSDKIYAYFLSLQGEIISISDVTAAYRIHNGGIWSKYNSDEKYRLHITQSLLFFKVISENSLKENELKEEFFIKLLLNDLFLLYTNPKTVLKRLIYLINNYRINTKIIVNSLRQYIKYYMFLFKNKVLL